VRVLLEQNALVREARPPRIDESLPITRAYWARIRSASWSQWRTWGTSSLAADDIERSIFEWERFQRSMLDFMRSYDVVITPVTAAPASDHRQLNGEDCIYTIPWSLTGQPAVVVRCATSSEGLPIGVQIVAGRWRDEVALTVGRLLENALGGWSLAEIA
jgi:amidase